MGVDQLVETMEGSAREVKRLQRQLNILMRSFSYFDEQSAHYMARTGSYAYIPLNLEDFTESLVDLETALESDPDYAHPKLPHRPISFLEVGCGIARNLFLVKHGSGLQIKEARGIEISREYVIQARQFFNLHDEVSVGDAMTCDYSSYDVIYFYRPFSDEKLERRFERRLVAMAKPGAYLIGHLNSIFDKSKELKPVHMFSRVYKKRAKPKAKRKKR